jgi:hypothetical protein
MEAMCVIKDWLAYWLDWIPGDGRDIRLVEDPLVGAKDFYKLLEGMRRELHLKGSHRLSHIGSVDETSPLGWN